MSELLSGPDHTFNVAANLLCIKNSIMGALVHIGYCQKGLVDSGARET